MNYDQLGDHLMQQSVRGQSTHELSASSSRSCKVLELSLRTHFLPFRKNCTLTRNIVRYSPKLFCMHKTCSQNNLGAFLIGRSQLRITTHHLPWRAIVTKLTRMRFKSQDKGSGTKVCRSLQLHHTSTSQEAPRDQFKSL